MPLKGFGYSSLLIFSWHFPQHAGHGDVDHVNGLAEKLTSWINSDLQVVIPDVRSCLQRTIDPQRIPNVVEVLGAIVISAHTLVIRRMSVTHNLKRHVDIQVSIPWVNHIAKSTRVIMRSALGIGLLREEGVTVTNFPRS